MHDRLIEILSGAKEWMNTSEITAAGKWRSVGNVAVALRQLTQSGTVAHRSKPGGFKKIDEWKHSDKTFPSDAKKAKPGKVQEPCPTESVQVEPPMPPAESVLEPAPEPDVFRYDDDPYVNRLRAELAELRSIVEDHTHFVGRLDLMLDGVDGQDIEHKVAALQHERIHAANCTSDAPGEARKLAGRTQRPPFSVSNLLGYRANGESITLFFDRSLSARSVTVYASDLASVVNSVVKIAGI